MCAMKSLTSLRPVSMAVAGWTIKVSAAAHMRCRSGIGERTLRTDQLAMRMQRHQYAEAGQQGNHGCAAVADQGQWHADHRQYAAHHSRIDENVDEETERDGAACQARKGTLSLHRQVQ